MRARLFFILTASFLAVSTSFLGAQETAVDYFRSVSKFYKGVEDYSGNVTMRFSGKVQRGKIYYKQRGKLLIQYSSPAGQILVVTPSQMQLYVPRYGITFTQDFTQGAKEGSSTTLLSLSSGLDRLVDSFGVAYTASPGYVLLSGANVQVRRVTITTKGYGGFKNIVFSILSNNVIRRVTGTLTNGRDTVQIDYTGIALNEGIPDARFEDAVPESSSGNDYDHFLYK